MKEEAGKSENQTQDYSGTVLIVIFIVGIYFYGDIGVPLGEAFGSILAGESVELAKGNVGLFLTMLVHFIALMTNIIVPSFLVVEYYVRKDDKAKSARKIKKKMLGDKKKAANLYLAPYKVERKS